MIRPNLVNKNNWTPFISIPTQFPTPISIPEYNQIPEIPKIMTRREVVQRNSFFLNFISMIIIIGIIYFLYSIYLERKIFAEYLNHLKNNQENNYAGFL